MTIKLLGAFLVVLAAYVIGASISSIYKNRVRRLEELLLSLEIFKTEVNYGLSLLPDVFNAIGNKIHSPVGSLFNRTGDYMSKQNGDSARDCWHKSLQDRQGDLELTQNQLALLQKMGMIWGKGDKNDQLRQANLVQELLRQALQEARQERERNEKMWHYLGLLGGFTIVILLF